METFLHNRSYSRFVFVLTGCTLSVLFCAQIFNNAAFRIAGPLTAGELISVIALLILVFAARIPYPLHHAKSGAMFLGALALYLISAAAALPIANFSPESSRFLATVFVQVLLSALVYFTTQPRHLGIVLRALGLLAAVLALLNYMNAISSNVDFLLIRDNVGRDWLRDLVGDRRVVTATNIYAQLGTLFVLGGVGAFGYYGEVANRTRRLRPKLFAYLILLSALMGILALQSRATILGLLVALSIYGWCLVQSTMRIIAIYVTFLLSLFYWHNIIDILVRMAAGFSDLHQSTVDSRLRGYRLAIDLIADNPVGVGQGQFRTLTDSHMVLHNTFLDAFVSTGWVGGSAFVAILTLPLVILSRPALARHRLEAGILGGYCGALVIALFYTGLTEYFLVLYGAAILGAHRTITLSRLRLPIGQLVRTS